MTVFELEHIDEINGIIHFYKLKKNGNCFFDNFEYIINNEGTYMPELDRIQSIMQQVSDLKYPPSNKFKNITRKKDKIKSYEIRTRNLRVYLFKDTIGNIIVTGGKKTSQESDIRYFRNLMIEYLENKKVN
jgi:hypothetical protein